MALMPSRTIATYVGTMFITRTVAVLAMLTLILLALDLLAEAGKIVAVPGNDEGDVWTYTYLRIPQLIAQFLPFSVLLATLITLAQLSQNSEVVIFKAAGISAHQILAPLFVVALGVALASFAFNELVLVQTNARLQRWKNADYVPLEELERAGSVELWARDGANLVHAERRRGQGAATIFDGVVLYRRADDAKLLSIAQADIARPVRNGWLLQQVREFNVSTGEVVTRPRELWRTSVEPDDFVVRDPDPDELPPWRLAPAIETAREAGKPVGSLIAALHHKFSGPLSAVLMPLLGAVAAFGLARSGQLFVRAVIGMALGFTFFVADNFLLAMGEFNAVPPIVAAWAPFFLFFLIGESVLVRTEE